MFAFIAVFAIIGSSDNAMFAVPIPKTNKKTMNGAIKMIDLGKRSIIFEAR